MTWDQFTILFDEWWATSTFIVALVFVLYYGLAAPWYKTPFGRALITIDLGLAVATFPTFMMFVFGDNISANRTLQWITIVIATTVPIAIAYRIVVLFNIRNRKFWKNFMESGKSTIDPDMQEWVDEAKRKANEE